MPWRWTAVFVALALGLSACVSDSGFDAGDLLRIDPNAVPNPCEVLDSDDIAAVFPNLEPGPFQDTLKASRLGRDCTFSWGSDGAITLRMDAAKSGRTWDDWLQIVGDDGCSDVAVGVFEKGMVCPGIFGDGQRYLYQWQEPIDGEGVLLEVLSAVDLAKAGDVDAGLEKIALLVSERATGASSLATGAAAGEPGGQTSTQPSDESTVGRSNASTSTTTLVDTTRAPPSPSTTNVPIPGFFDGLAPEWAADRVNLRSYGIHVVFIGGDEPGQVFAEIDYPGLGCSGIWTLTNANGNAVSAIETIDRDPDNRCISSGTITLVREGSVLRYRWTRDAAPTDNAVLLPTG